MKLSAPLALALSLCLVACGDSNAAEGGASSGSSTAPVTDPAELPSDQEGLAKVYEQLMEDAVETIEGIDTQEQLQAGLDKLSEMGPAFAAVMERSEELGLGVEEGLEESLGEIGDRMQVAVKELFQKFPTDAMAIQNALTEAVGSSGPR